MRIILDLQACQTESKHRGIGRYALNLGQAIARNADSHEVWLVLSTAFPGSIEGIRAHFDGLVPPDRIRVFDIPIPVAEVNPANSHRTRIAELIREEFLETLHPDIVLVFSLFEGYIDDAVSSCGHFKSAEHTAVILHDLIPFLNQDVYLPNKDQRIWYLRKIQSLKTARLLLSNSDHTRTEAIQALGLSADRIINISTGNDDFFKPITVEPIQRANLLERYEINLEFILYVPGGFDARKNFGNLLQAYARLPQALRLSHQLVIASKVSENDRAYIEQLAHAAGLQNGEVVLTGYVPDSDLIGLYNIAKLFIFPSWHEGFGLPALEAMACGTPTIGSNCTSLPEVIGRKDALFDPHVPDSMALLMSRALTDNAWRRELQEHSLNQSAKFSWDKVARKAIAALENVINKNARSDSTSRPKVSSYGSLYRRLLSKVGESTEEYHLADDELVCISRSIAANEQAVADFSWSSPLPLSITWRIEGPFDSSYSLALVNREVARALKSLGHVMLLHSTEGPGDYPPNQDFLNSNPDIAEMFYANQRVLPDEIDIVSRQLYPPRVHDMVGRLNLLHSYAWEESAFPREWVDAFNRYLQGIICVSAHVEKILIDNGVVVPLAISGNGVDHWCRINSDPMFRVRGRSYRFLHVSSCFPRKGVDVLLESYGMAFRNSDDVSLVIKTFANPHNDVRQQIESWINKDKSYPDVVLIEDELPDDQLKALYQACHCLVAPSRAEGFGLPIAEAMLSGLPVVTTAWGGQLDFCDETTAWLVDYRFARAQTHFGLYDSVWAEPNMEDLARKMREVYSAQAEVIRAKVGAAQHRLNSHFSWHQVGEKLTKAARRINDASPFSPRPRIGWITTWNARCGIASYSDNLIFFFPDEVMVFANTSASINSPDEANIIRCWSTSTAERFDSLGESLSSNGIDVIIVQFNYGFYGNFDAFSAFLSEQVALGRVVIIILHSTSDPVHAPERKLVYLRDALSLCHRILVHSVADLNCLKGLGLVDNVTLFPHGIKNIDPAPISRPAPNQRMIIASYGFFLPHKGLGELVEAVAACVADKYDLHLLMINAQYPAPQSAEAMEDVLQRIKVLGISDRVTMVTDFLSDAESLGWLAHADLIVFPYQETGESSSAAVRAGIASGRPVAVTPLSIFEDVGSCVFTLPGVSSFAIAQGIKKILAELKEQTAYATSILCESQKWRNAHDYSLLAKRLYGMIVALFRKKVGEGYRPENRH